MEVYIIIHRILLAICSVYSIYFFITGASAFIKMRKSHIKRYAPKNKFAIIVPSRNEETVISQLIDSLKRQSYPENLYDIYVIPNNCTDNTASVAKSAGAKVIECEVPVKSKGEVLKYTFDKLKKDKTIDAYIVFDSDNVVHENFLARMNDALCDGYVVAQGNRDSKNPTDNWISGSYSIFYWLQNFFFNRSRMVLGGSASINGTGFMIKKNIIDTEGFNTYTLTEDVEFSGQCALKNRKIAFVEDAITYDEQPYNFKTSWIQRSRWSTGNLQCVSRYNLDMLKAIFTHGSRKMPLIDMSLMYIAPIVQILSTVLGIITVAFDLVNIESLNVFMKIYINSLGFSVIIYLISVALNVFIVKYNDKKEILKMIPGILLFPLFILTWIPINIKILFKKEKKWTEIRHTRSIDIKDI